jgi:hypothetical protein
MMKKDFEKKFFVENKMAWTGRGSFYVAFSTNTTKSMKKNSNPNLSSNIGRTLKSRKKYETWGFEKVYL